MSEPKRVFYKATRPDGYDFATGTVLYEVGKRVRPKPCRERRICGPGYLHAADVPAETLLGGSWPCRLFEVEGKPEVGFDSRHPHKGGFRQLTVVRELPAHQALGPNGEAVAALIDRAGKLTVDEAQKLAAAGDAARDAAWDAAWGAAWDAAWNAARGAARRAARGAARDAAWEAAWNATREAAWGAAWEAAWEAAWDAARDAALALVARDLIPQKHFDVLYGPWREVVER